MTDKTRDWLIRVLGSIDAETYTTADLIMLLNPLVTAGILNDDDTLDLDIEEIQAMTKEIAEFMAIELNARIPARKAAPDVTSG